MLSLRNLAEMFLLRGFELRMKLYGNGRSASLRCSPTRSDGNGNGKMGRRCYVDETHIKVKGK